MIDLSCTCGTSDHIPESEAGKPWLCPSCGKRTYLICAEPLDEGSGAGDFDASLKVASGPSFVGERMLIGGVANIEIGRADGKHVNLAGNTVSHNHCHLERVDFGPSRWAVVDDGAKFGTLVNGERVSRQELHNGDMITVGEFALSYSVAEPAPQRPVAHLATAVHTATASTATTSKPKVKPVLAAGRAASAPKKLAYASAATDGEPLPLGDCDTAWVMKLRNASTLMIYVLIANSVGRWLSFSEMLNLAVGIIASIMSIGAAWLLTTPEPGVKNNWFGIRGFLRFFAIVGGIGEILGGIDSMIGHGEDDVGASALAAISALLAIALIPQTALFLLYLRKLAKRIPNEGLAFGAAFVMVGLPVFMALGAYSAWQVIATHAKSGIGTGLLAILGLIAMRFTYICLLFWFNRSFS